MRALLGLAVAAAFVFTVGACGDTASKDDCKKLLDHIIQLEMNAAGTGNLTPDMKADIEGQKKKLTEYLEKGFVDKCTKETPGSYVQCGLKAKDLGGLAECDKE
jgi:hypothetical protein